MKKITAFLAILLSLIFTVPLVACGEAGSGSAPPSNDPKEETIPDLPTPPDPPSGGAGHGKIDSEEKSPENTEEEKQEDKHEDIEKEEDPKEDPNPEEEDKAEEGYDVELGEETYRGFLLDCVYHAKDEGDIHFNVYFPESYDGSEAYALYFTLPGYEGLYFQGVGVNLRAESYAFEAQKYNEEMIIVAPQLSDWGMTSARQTVALVRYFLSAYNIDETKVYANGYSGGGETMSQVMELAPELFTAYLHCSAQWNGDLKALARARTPVYMAIGKNDEYYGSARLISSYNELVSLYREQNLSEEEIEKLVILDVKDHSYFTERGISNEHGGGGLFAQDAQMMGWLFGHVKSSV